MKTLELNDISIRNLFVFQYPFSRKSGSLLKFFISDTIRSLNLPKVKAICLDFDNTLWQGIIGDENKFSNLFSRSNSSFLVFQNKLKELKNQGILLCLITKNNSNDINLFFEENKQMPLKLDDFILIKSNWDPKSINIAKVVEELNISPNTFMYFDDSDFEIEEVSTSLPEIRSYKVTEDNLVNLILLIPEFQEIISRNKLIDKTAEYKKEFKRKTFLSYNKESSDPYNLKSFKRLEVKLEIRNRKLDLNRISEMSEKTNQFNFNKKILSVSDIKKLIDSKHNFFTCSATDKYGDYGIIGYLHLNPKHQIENFVMSCRALSRGIEFKFVEHIVNLLNLSQFIIKFKETNRNMPSKIFINKYTDIPKRIINS